MLLVISFHHNLQMSQCRRLIPSIAFKTPTQHPSPLPTLTRENQLCITLRNQSKHNSMPTMVAVDLHRWAHSLAHLALTRARSCLPRHWALGRQICHAVHFHFRQRRCRCERSFLINMLFSCPSFLSLWRRHPFEFHYLCFLNDSPPRCIDHDSVCI